ncbi:MAG: peptidoglycan bridge formation glycyltransferase FemA/FemB family protein [Bacteroidales bacterium]
MVTDIFLKDNQQLFSTPVVQQSTFWSVVKNRLGDRTMAVDFSINQSDLYIEGSFQKNIESDILVVLQYVDGTNCLAYVPYGPEIEPDDDLQALFLEELSENLRSVLPHECFAIRFDLHWESLWAKEEDLYDDSGMWKGTPEISSQELRFNFTTQNWNLKKSSQNVLPSNTIYIDLKPDLETVLQHMKPKTRYNIRLSMRKGVDVLCVGIEYLPVWYALYSETCKRNGIFLHDIEYFRTLFSAQFDKKYTSTELFLLIAEYNETPVAAMFLTCSSHRASYLYGASSAQHRHAMATYAIQWKAMQLAKEKGCTEYDMFGVSPNPDPDHPMYGLYKFKSGFGGHMYHAMGCWDYPLNDAVYTCYKAAEMQSQGFHVS